MNSILNRIGLHKKEEISVSKRKQPLSSFDLNRWPILDFIANLQKHSPAIIAEIKKASPSKGVIRENFNPVEIAEVYTQHGAACLSVLTDRNFFQGDPGYIEIVKNHSTLPVLRKDFIIDEYQIYESRALGADCMLLIIAMLDDHQLHDFCQLAQELNMAVLVESHTRDELERALELPTPLMGVNNRSLHSFQTDLQCSVHLKKYIPDNKIMISESGIHTRADIKFLQEQNIHHFLIGESLMQAADIGAALEELLG